MSVEIIGKQINNKYVLNNEIEVIITDIIDFDFYDDVRGFIDDHSYLLNETETADDIIESPIAYEEFMSYMNNNISYTNRLKEVLYLRARGNEDAEYHLYLIEDIEPTKEGVLRILNKAVSEYKANPNNKLKNKWCDIQ